MGIKETVEKLIKKHNSNNPFEIAKEMGIQIEYADLGDTLGFYFYDKRMQFINISNAVDEAIQKFVCAHELGHAVLHKHSNTPFLSKNTLYSIAKIEREANQFAVTLLSHGADVYAGMTIKECGQTYGIPENVRDMIKY